MSVLVHTTELVKTYETGDVRFQALGGVSLEIESGDFLAVMGPSGSGKSTLLHLLGGLDRPTSGSVVVDGRRLNEMDETALAKFRRAHIGFVFQFFNLIDNLTVRANVELPALLVERRDKRAVRRRSQELLAALGIADQAEKHPWELSGGQQQRVAIARSLINHPTLLLGDEPTGNLDSSSGEAVLEILQRFNAAGQTILIVTHDPVAAACAREIIFLHDGQVRERMPGGDAKRVARRLAGLS